MLEVFFSELRETDNVSSREIFFLNILKYKYCDRLVRSISRVAVSISCKTHNSVYEFQFRNEEPFRRYLHVARRGKYKVDSLIQQIFR